ncbi:ROK family protein [Candidatus Zixiibacteriota bacterium]
MQLQDDARVVMTLDAGGTNFVFGAIGGGDEIVEPVNLPAEGDDLDRSVANILEGFSQVVSTLEASLGVHPVAISFAFPGPADYTQGVIGDLGNLPGYRGGVPLGAIIEDRFDLPVFINNDGDLFAFGEAIAGFLPWLNSLMEEAGSPKRFRNLLGVTLGTGFGGGIVTDGRLHIGDNSAGGEIWCLRNRSIPNTTAEESVSIRGVQRSFAASTGTDLAAAPSPKEIYLIGMGESDGDRDAARSAWHDFGMALGDALANAITLIDAPIVIGGGVAGAHKLFLPSVIEEMNSGFTSPEGEVIPRMELQAFNIEQDEERHAFCHAASKELTVPGGDRVVPYDPLKRVGVGVTRLGTSRATAVGAYAFALSQLDSGQR